MVEKNINPPTSIDTMYNKCPSMCIYIYILYITVSFIKCVCVCGVSVCVSIYLYRIISIEESTTTYWCLAGNEGMIHIWQLSN